MSRAPPKVDVPQRALRAKPSVGTANRPPSYMSRKELAWELSVCETTIDELVRRGTIPAPIRLTDGCMRWWWPGVEAALANADGAGEGGDAYMTGASNAVA
jgi:predicted DNA-binding transcriptional regulator AlpA